MSLFQVFDFLRELQKYNNKSWMDEHRDEYESARDFMRDWAEQTMQMIADEDPSFQAIEAKKSVSRINNNLLYHPEKPTYKDNFGVEMPLGTGPSGFYVHMALEGSFIGGGMHNPNRDQLKAIRVHIDKHGQGLADAVSSKYFTSIYDDISRDDSLKTAPRDYDQDHQYIEYLRLKSFAAMHSITQKDIFADDFQDMVLRSYKALQPLGNWLNGAF